VRYNGLPKGGATEPHCHHPDGRLHGVLELKKEADSCQKKIINQTGTVRSAFLYAWGLSFVHFQFGHITNYECRSKIFPTCSIRRLVLLIS
jgi:hypothetical protein